jgi:predicted alpha/beta superfamily hydrolase
MIIDKLRQHALASFLIALPACTATPAAETPCSISTASATGAPANGNTSAAPRKLVIENSEIIELSSEATGRAYELIVGLPPSYASEPERHYPVLYLLDGQWDFNLVNTLSGGLRYDKVVPEFLVVGISYGGDHPNYEKLRGEDYSPTRSHPAFAKEPFGGDAPKFLSFLEQKILPTIEGRYRVDTTQRIISGSSLGGLFSLYALFEKPDLFQSVIALSPAVGWDDRYLFKREQQFHAAHPSLKQRVWLSVGADEWPDYTQSNRDFFSQFQASKYDGVSLKVQVVEGERHAGVKPEGYNRALRFVFEPWAATQKE